MKIKNILLAGMCLSTLLLGRQESVTLDELIFLALKHSPDIDISRLDVKAGQSREAFAKGYHMPRIDAGFTSGKMSITQRRGVSHDSSILGASLRASQLLYDFGKTGGQIDASIEKTLALDAQLQQQILFKIFNIKQAYYSILKSDKIIKVQQENVKLSGQQLSRAKSFFESGIRTMVDVSDAKLQLTTAELNLKNAEYGKEMKIVDLIRIVGYVPENQSFKLYEKKIPLPHPSKYLPAPSGSLRSLQHYAFSHRFELKSQEHIIQGTEASVKSKKGDYYPTLTLGGSVDKRNFETTSMLENFLPKERWDIGVNAEWNLFTGFQTDNSIEEAKIGVQRAKSAKIDLKLQIQKEVANAYLLTKRARDAVVLSESLVETGSLKYTQTLEQYESDLSDYLKLQEAQQDYIVAMTRLTNAYYDYLISLAYLDLAMGKHK